MKCKRKGCGRESVTRGYCDMHYRRVKRRGEPGLSRPFVSMPTAQEKRLMIKLYADLQSTEKVGKRTGFSAEAVRMTLHREGILLASVGSGTQKDVDESYFDKWSPAMAWCLGLLWTDGHITKKGSIELTSGDKEMLVKFRRLVSGEQRISKVRDLKNNYSWYRYRVESVNIAARLHDLGMKTNKSLRRLPKVPKKYLNHYVRGVFDGDGSVYWVKRDRAPQVSFAVAPKRMKDDLVKVLRQNGYCVHASEDTKWSRPGHGPRRVVGHCWNVKLNKLDDIGRFNLWIYRKAPKDIRLERKYQTFEGLISRYLDK